MADKRDEHIAPDPIAVKGLQELGLAGYLRQQFELCRGVWREWECGENDEDLCGAWEDGDPEQAAWFAALLEGAEKLGAEVERLREDAERYRAIEAHATYCRNAREWVFDAAVQVVDDFAAFADALAEATPRPRLWTRQRITSRNGEAPDGHPAHEDERKAAE